MTTVGDLLDALEGYRRAARVWVLVDTAAASDIVWQAKQDQAHDIDTVEPVGGSLISIQITLAPQLQWRRPKTPCRCGNPNCDGK